MSGTRTEIERVPLTSEALGEYLDRLIRAERVYRDVPDGTNWGRNYARNTIHVLQVVREALLGSRLAPEPGRRED